MLGPVLRQCGDAYDRSLIVEIGGKSATASEATKICDYAFFPKECAGCERERELGTVSTGIRIRKRLSNDLSALIYEVCDRVGTCQRARFRLMKASFLDVALRIEGPPSQTHAFDPSGVQDASTTRATDPRTSSGKHTLKSETA